MYAAAGATIVALAALAAWIVTLRSNGKLRAERDAALADNKRMSDALNEQGPLPAGDDAQRRWLQEPVD